MDIYPLHRCPDEAIQALLNTLGLYKAVHQAEPEQFQVLVKHSQLVDLGPGETVIAEGEIDTWLYFLIKGGLAVYAGEKSLKRVNAITPGEVFGDMAVLLHLTRSATIIADTQHRRSLVLRLDFSIFGDPDDFSHINLPVKLTFYRFIVSNLRWKLELYRTQYPSHRYASQHRSVKLFKGDRDSLDELKHLDEQARRFAQLLIAWNLALTQAESSSD